jgi:hypothetical protein
MKSFKRSTLCNEKAERLNIKVGKYRVNWTIPLEVDALQWQKVEASCRSE